MAKTTSPKRSAKCIFNNNEDIRFFYEDILLFCESDRTSFGSFNILKQAAKALTMLKPFDFVYNNYEKEMRTPKDNVFYFSAEAEKQDSNKKSKVVKQWFKHIRNAFAHNYIILDKGIYHFYDFCGEKGKKPKQTLYARITSLDDFKKLILEVKSKIIK